MNIKIKKFNLKDYRKVNKIYKQSFPKEERAPLWLLIFNILLNRAELYCLLENDDISGFIYLISCQDMIFILYLAIDQKKRSKGYGSYILNWCLKNKKGKNIYLNIDELDKKFDDFEIRQKRLKFYLDNGFNLTDYLSIEKKCNFNILTTNKIFNLEQYKKLDKKVANCLLNSKSKIVKKETILVE